MNIVFIISLSIVSFVLLILILVIAIYKIPGHCERKKKQNKDDGGIPEVPKSTQNGDAYSGDEQYVDFGCLDDENEHQYQNMIDRENQLQNDDANEQENPYDDYYEYPETNSYWPVTIRIIDGCAESWNLFISSVELDISLVRN